MLKVLVVVFTGCLAVAAASVVRLNSKVSTKFKDCGSGGKIADVTVDPCPKEPCVFKRGTNVSVNIDFTSGEDFPAASTKVYGIIAGISVPFPLPDTDACHNMKCPVAKGRPVNYKNAVFVSPSYPKIKLVVKWEVLDKSDNIIFCFEVPVIIQD